MSKMTPVQPGEPRLESGRPSMNTASLIDKNMSILGKVDVSQKSYKKFEKELRTIQSKIKSN
jgi:deoxyhypusine synthase